MGLKYEKPGKPAKKKFVKHNLRPNSFSKKDRVKIYQKYDGRCSYCGNDLEPNNFEVDHLTPVRAFKYKWNADFEDNLLPSCKECNRFKSSMSLNKFRKSLITLKSDLLKIHKFRVANNFGIVSFLEFDGEFFFEKFKRGAIK